MNDTNDSSMGDWVYCCSHLRPHSTGWCSIEPTHKIRLGTTGYTADRVTAAYAECRALGLHIFQEETPYDWQTQADLARVLGGRHYYSWLVPDRARRDALIAKLKAAVAPQGETR